MADIKQLKKSSWVIFIDKKKARVLLLKRSQVVRNSGQWCFPGGSSNSKKARKLAKKEALEEVGLKLKDVELFVKARTKTKRYYFYIFFLKPKKSEIILNEESDKFKWVKLKDIDNQKNLHRSVKLFIKNYRDGKSKFERQAKTYIWLRQNTR